MNGLLFYFMIEIFFFELTQLQTAQCFLVKTSWVYLYTDCQMRPQNHLQKRIEKLYPFLHYKKINLKHPLRTRYILSAIFPSSNNTVLRGNGKGFDFFYIKKLYYLTLLSSSEE